MALPVIELVGWALWEFVFALIFYNTGAALLRVLSLGRLKFPLIWSRSFNKEKLRPRNISFCYITGGVFYISLIAILLSIYNPN